MPSRTPRSLRTRLLSTASLAVLSFGLVAAGALPGGGLHDLMEDMKDNFRTVMRGLSAEAKGEGEADSDALVAATAEMQRLLLLSKAEMPSNLEEIGEADRPAHITAFRIDMAKALISSLELEIKLLEGDHEGALELARNSLIKERDDGHDKYQSDHDDDSDSDSHERSRDGRGKGRGDRDR